LQTALDETSTIKIGELLFSPKNTEDSKISVEIPLLSDDDNLILTIAIVETFNKYEVSLSNVIFITYQPEPDRKTFEVSIWFS